jgi:hypothetical protein
LRLNYIGIVGGILAFISLALPWWTLTLSAMGMSVNVSAYPYKATASFMGLSMDIPMEAWYGSAALVLIILGGILGILGSVMPAKGKSILAIGGVLALLSIIIFAAGLQGELSKGLTIPSPTTGGSSLPLPEIGLFSSGTWTMPGVPVPMNYTSYLSFGFWLALVAAIIIFAAIKKAVLTPAVPTPAAPPPP